MQIVNHQINHIYKNNKNKNIFKTHILSNFDLIKK